ncbi:hypothetical protein TIFTF001_028779 [Ficus carica]|uniref:Pentatricopeptide repeat-containing protein n=1 Tax=Ficus carica TaxID=3494 RepID=A0AA88J1K3_FICCA|nr:hypothetical protein TIFTF001_028779 [Ficus carica]
MLTPRTPGNSSLFSLFRIFIPSQFRSYASVNGDYDSFPRLEKLVQLRCKSKDLTLSEALGFFNSLIKIRPIPSIRIFNQLFAAISNMSHYSTVVSMYREIMGRVDFRPNVLTLNIVIKCFCCLKELKLGFSVFATMVKKGLQPDAFTLSTPLHELCKEGSMVAAMELFRQIEEEEFFCDVVTYTTRLL